MKVKRKTSFQTRTATGTCDNYNYIDYDSFTVSYITVSHKWTNDRPLQCLLVYTQDRKVSATAVFWQVWYPDRTAVQYICRQMFCWNARTTRLSYHMVSDKTTRVREKAARDVRRQQSCVTPRDRRQLDNSVNRSRTHARTQRDAAINSFSCHGSSSSICVAVLLHHFQL